MTPEEIAETLAAGRDLQVATLGSDGWPHLTTLWYAVVDGVVTFRSFRKSQRIVNLRRDPRCTVLVALGDTYEELRGVMIQGTARLDDDPEHVLQVWAAVQARMVGEPIDHASAEAIFGEHAHKNTAVSVEPRHVVSWDHRKLGGRY